MVGPTRKEVELRINANDLSRKSLSELLDTFNKLKDSQESLSKSSDGTQRHMRELTQELKDLQAVAVELKARSSLVDQFLDIQTSATTAATRVDAAKAALQAFNAAQSEGTKLTKEQKKTFNLLSREVKNSEENLVKSTGRLTEFEEKMKGLGAGDSINAFRNNLIQLSGDLGSALTSAETSIRKYDEALRANAQQARLTAFKAQAQEALNAAASFDQLTRDYDKLAVSSRKAGDGIREVIDPSRQAVATLDALEAEVRRLNAQLDSVQTGPKLGEELKQIRAQYNAFAADAGRAAASLVDDIGSYRKAEEAVAALRARLEATQESVRQFAQQMGDASEPSEKLARDLGASQTKLKGIVAEFDRESVALANLRLRLREAGVDVNKLADAEARLAGVAGGVVESHRKIEAVAVRVNKLADAADALKASEEKLAFNQVGVEAEKAADSIEVLSRDYDALARSSRKAGDGIRGILDPSRQALASLDGLEEQTKRLNDELRKAASSAKLREEVRQLRSEYGSLATDAGKAAAALVDNIGAYRQSEQAHGTLRARVEDAQQSVRDFARQMAAAASPSEDLAKSLNTAKGRLAALVADFERQSTALAKVRAELREAGVDTDKLSEAEKRLQNVAHGVVRAQEALGVAALRVGEGANKAGKGLGLFDDHGRKALSTAQRLRGELLSLASSYLGLFAAINVAKGSVDAAVTREGIMRRLELTEGSAEKAKVKFDELRKSADDLGVNFEASAKGFSDIAIGAKEAGLSSAELDRFFLNLSTTTRGLALDGEKTSRVFTAVSQVFGKNKLQAEELTGQLGEHLPAVVTKAAKALDMSSEELLKNMQAGNLSVRTMVVIFDEYAKHIGTLSVQNNSAVKALARFGNAMTDLKLAIADSGFLEVFTKLLEQASEAVKDGKLNDAAKGFGEVLTVAAKAAGFLLENIRLTEVVFLSFIALNVAKLFLGIAVSMKTLGIGAGFAAGATRALGAAFAFISGHPLVALIALLAGLAVATDTGRGVFRALGQTIKEVGDAIGDLLAWDLEAFFKRLKGTLDRIVNAFWDAKEEAGKVTRTVGTVERPSRAGGAAPTTNTGGASGSWGDDEETEESKRLELAERTARQVAGVEDRMGDLSKAAAKARARVIRDTEAEVRAEYADTQREIDELLQSAAKAANPASAEAIAESARSLQAKFNKDVAAIVAARKKEEADQAAKFDHRSTVAEALEAAKQRAEATKDGLRLEQAELEQNYKEGLVSLRGYYAERLNETLRGLDAEIKAAQEQIKILEKETKVDPNAAKKITKLTGDIAGKEKEQTIARRASTLETALAEKALRRQVSVVQDELDLLTGNERQAGMRAIQNFYDDQLEKTNELEGAEKDRELATLKTLKGLKEQLLEIQLLRKEAEHLFELQHAKIDTQVASGNLSHLQELDARSKANQRLLDQLDAERAKYILNGQEGSDAYKKVLVEIERLRGSTDLLEQEVTAVFKGAAASFVTTLIDTKSPEKALKSFGKSLGTALAQSFVDGAATNITKWFKESGGFKSLLGLFKGIGGLFSSNAAHTGAVIGYGGSTPRAVSPLAFIGAPRYHSGGLPGLRRDEVAFIGLKGEEVLSKSDPRNALNGGKNPSTPGPSSMRVEVHPDALRMTLRDWLESELARAASTQ